MKICNNFRRFQKNDRKLNFSIGKILVPSLFSMRVGREHWRLFTDIHDKKRWSCTIPFIVGVCDTLREYSSIVYSRRIVTVVVNDERSRWLFTIVAIHRKVSYMTAVNDHRQQLSFFHRNWSVYGRLRPEVIDLGRFSQNYIKLQNVQNSGIFHLSMVVFMKITTTYIDHKFSVFRNHQ
jgi:hypothetical protein